MANTSAGVPKSLEAVKLSCVRGDRLVFEALEFTLVPGEVLQLVGANGSGKTSLLRLLSGLALPYAGTVRWDGRDVHQQRLFWHRNLCVIGHLSGVSASLTARENLAVAVALGAGGLHANVVEALGVVGLSTCIDTLAARLSAGQRQRIALARLVMSKAPVWLLDEPLTALDLDGKRLVESLLRTHTSRGGLAVLATHQPVDSSNLNVRNFQLRGVGSE